MIRRTAHSAAVAIGRVAARMLPDRVPVTFVGAGSVAELCAAIGGQGRTWVLVVTDRVLVELGIVETVTDALRAAGVDAVVYDAIEPDPTFAQVEGGHLQATAWGCDAVLAVGGGSPIDAAKMIAAMATNGGASLLGRSDEIGSLEVGKLADVVLVDVDRLDLAGALSDPLTAIVFAGIQHRVKTVIVHGDILVEDGALQRMHEEEITRRSQELAFRLLRRAGVSPPWGEPPWLTPAEGDT